MKRPLFGEFLLQSLKLGTGKASQKEISAFLGLQESTLSRLVQSGEDKYSDYESRLWKHTLPDGIRRGMSAGEIDKYRVQFSSTVAYLKELHEQVGTEIDPKITLLAKKFLIDEGYLTEDGRATALLTRLKESQVELQKHTTAENQPRPVKSQAVSIGANPENFVGDLCKMGAVEVEGVTESDTLKVFVNLAFGCSTRTFGDLVATCGLKGAKITSELSGLQVVDYHHTREPLRGRLARLTDRDEFLVKQTCVGPPDPFLLDSVFEDASFISINQLNDGHAADLHFSCTVEFSDLEVEAYTADGEKFLSLTEEQKKLRKLALEHFILKRCEASNFEGIIAQARWNAHDQN